MRNPWVSCTNAGSKFPVTLGFVFLLHFLKRIANDRTKRIKHPITLRATEVHKTLALNPTQLG